MMIANYKINAFGIGIRYLLNRFDAAIQRYNQAEPIVCRIVYTLCGYAISFPVTIRNIIFQVIIMLVEETVNQSNRCCAIHIVIAIDQYFFTGGNSGLNAFNRLFL